MLEPTTDSNHRFLVIDDDPTSNLICQLTLEMALGKVPIQTFTSARLGLAHIESEFTKPQSGTATLFLDINMPVMSGWEFLELLDRLETGIKNRLTIYILSSSVDYRDKERSYANKNVKDHLTKPITKDVIHDIEKFMKNKLKS